MKRLIHLRSLTILVLVLFIIHSIQTEETQPPKKVGKTKKIKNQKNEGKQLKRPLQPAPTLKDFSKHAKDNPPENIEELKQRSRFKQLSSIPKTKPPKQHLISTDFRQKQKINNRLRTIKGPGMNVEPVIQYCRGEKTELIGKPDEITKESVMVAGIAFVGTMALYYLITKVF